MRVITRFLLPFVLVCASRSEPAPVRFNCTFNEGLAGDCVFRALLPTANGLQTSEGQMVSLDDAEPFFNRPWSDATSVCR